MTRERREAALHSSMKRNRTLCNIVQLVQNVQVQSDDVRTGDRVIKLNFVFLPTEERGFRVKPLVIVLLLKKQSTNPGCEIFTPKSKWKSINPSGSCPQEVSQHGVLVVLQLLTQPVKLSLAWTRLP